MTELNQMSVSLTGAEANTLFFEPIFMDKDILSMFRVIPNVTSKKKLGFVQELEKIVRKYSGCGFQPAGSTKIYERWIETNRAKAEVALCWEEFKDTVYEELLKRGTSIADLTDTQISEILLTSMTNGIKKDVQRLAFFGNTASSNSAYDAVDGLWTVHIPAFVAATQTAYTNAGTDALTAGDGIDLLKSVHAAQDNRLAGLPDRDKKFFVARTVYEAYRNDIEDGGGGDAGIRLLQDGTEVLTFRGIEVVPMYLWGEIMSELSITTVHRVLLTTPQNLAVATDLADTGALLKTWFNEDEEELRSKARFRLGFQVVHPSLMSVAY